MSDNAISRPVSAAAFLDRFFRNATTPRPRRPGSPHALACGVVAAILAVGAALPAGAAEPYPSKSIRLVIPYATGGVSDAIGRLIAAGLSKELGQTVYPENRGGGGGTIGAAVVAKATPDGYTILLTSPPMVTVAPVMLANLSYDPIKDFTAIGTLVTTPNILVVTPGLPVKTMAELISYAKGDGEGKLSFASAGPGSTGHLSGQLLMNSAGIRMEHIPYKSSGLSFPDVLAGRVSMVFDSLPSTIGYIRQGSVRPIAVMSEKRSPVLPDVPTAAESGLPAATMTFWMGLEGPAGMPPAVVAKLSEALKAALQSKTLQEQFNSQGAEVYFTSPDEFAELRRKDAVKYGKVARDAGLKPEM